LTILNIEHEQHKSFRKVIKVDSGNNAKLPCGSRLYYKKKGISIWFYYPVDHSQPKNDVVGKDSILSINNVSTKHDGFYYCYLKYIDLISSTATTNTIIKIRLFVYGK